MLAHILRWIADKSDTIFFFKREENRMYEAFWMNSRSKKKEERNTIIYFNENYRRKIKLVPIIMDYSLL